MTAALTALAAVIDQNWDDGRKVLGNFANNEAPSAYWEVTGSFPDTLTMLQWWSGSKEQWKALWRPKRIQPNPAVDLVFDSLHHSRTFPAFSEVNYYGCSSFDLQPATPTSIWGDLDGGRFFLPRLIVHWDGSGTSRFTYYFPLDQQNPTAIWRGFAQRFRFTKQTGQLGQVTGTSSIPDQEGFCTAVRNTTERLAAGDAGKAVLAGYRKLEMDTPIDSSLIIQGLDENSENSYLFAVASPSGTSFISRSPERLLQWSDGGFSIDALAGTRPRGQNQSQDQALEADLLNSAKDRKEHRWVQEYIEGVLEQQGCSFSCEANMEILKLSKVQHIASRYSGQVGSGDDALAKLIFALNPTPAVCGQPKVEALKLIANNEGWQRGLYAGACGKISKGTGDLAIAIRSALIDGYQLLAFAGAGIVEDSSPRGEWREIQAKMRNFTTLFDSSPAIRSPHEHQQHP